jgi:hypothetical protein
MKKKNNNILKTAALLELTGPLSNEDIAAKKTFEYYWANKCKYSLPFNKFPIYNTEGSIKKKSSIIKLSL